MENEFLSNPDELINNNNQLDSTLCFPASHDVSFGNTTNSTESPIGVCWTHDLLDGAIFIVSNGTYQTNNIPKDWQHPVDLVTLNENHNQAEKHLELSTEDLSYMAVDNTSASENHSTSFDQQSGTSLGASACIEQLLQEINQLKNNLGPWLNEIFVQNQEPESNSTPIVSNTVVANNDQHVNTVQLHNTHYVEQIDQSSVNISSIVPSTLSNTTENFPILSASTLALVQCEAPEILNQPKKEWHYRNMKDLAKNQIPLLAGDGSQRKLTRVKVPPQGTYSMYLGIKVQTYDSREHRSKIPVPEGTTVSMDLFSNDNNLDRLQFDRCDSTDYFDREHAYVYSKISLEEHEAGEKE
ncbi:unnamed protein product [Rotaria sp. Silwood1]|nr:unnamed protein product [Rotaria sp. Silwood1]